MREVGQESGRSNQGDHKKYRLLEQGQDKLKSYRSLLFWTAITEPADRPQVQILQYHCREVQGHDPQGRPDVDNQYCVALLVRLFQGVVQPAAEQPIRVRMRASVSQPEFFSIPVGSRFFCASLGTPRDAARPSVLDPVIELT